MPRLADATAYLKSDNTDLKKGLDEGEQDVSGWGDRLGSVMQGVGLSIGMGVAGIVTDAAARVGQFIADSVGAASDLNETVSKAGVVFGDQSTAILAWAETAATALGQSKQGALDAASGFGNLFVSMGMATGPSADMSMGLVQLASDLASFNNMDPTEALEKLRAGMLGSAEPMQSLGVNMTAASVTAKALEMGLAATADALTPAMLAQARYAIILEQTKTAQGDFTRTSDGLANQQRIMDAQWKDLSATVGQALLPVQLALISTLNKLTQDVLPPLSGFITTRVVPAMEAISSIIRSSVGPMIEQAKQWFTSLGTTMNGQVNGPMNYLSGWFYQNMPRIQQIVNTVVSALTAFWETHGERITAITETLFGWMTAFWDTQFKTILNILQAALQLMTGDFDGAGATIRGILNDWRIFFERVFREIGQMITSIDWGGIGRRILDALWAGMRASWDAGIDWFRDRLQEMRNMLPFSEPRDANSPLRGLSRSGEAIVEQVRLGIDRAPGWTLPNLQMPALTGASGGPVNITINISGAADGTGVGLAARDGLLTALRSAGLR